LNSLSNIIFPNWISFLGKGVESNAFAKFLVMICNKMGILDNLDDSEEGITKVLEDNFESTDVWAEGVVIFEEVDSGGVRARQKEKSSFESVCSFSRKHSKFQGTQ
jgi:hypothetical protein